MVLVTNGSEVPLKNVVLRIDATVGGTPYYNRRVVVRRLPANSYEVQSTRIYFRESDFVSGEASVRMVQVAN